MIKKEQQTALIVVCHPKSDSFTQQISHGIIDESGHLVEIADLAAEGFNPSFTAADYTAFSQASPVPADILVEHERLKRANALILVFPLYWWSFPALLKGWIDRVFTNGFAYGTHKYLADLPIYLVQIVSSSDITYQQHGYLTVINTQIQHGIFDYAGAKSVKNEIFNLDLGVRVLLNKALILGK